MIFNSLTYLVLLFTVVLLYWVLPYRARLALVFISSLTFYAFWRIEFLPVMLISVLVDYFVAKQIPTSDRKKSLLWISLVVNLGLLFYFKYLIFFADNAIGLANLFGAEIDPLVLKIILPLGISFYTFQTISYTIDVYRGQIEPEKNFLLYACYVTFFPQLIAGPILRAGEVIHQFATRPPFCWADIGIGLRRIAIGLFLKVVLADNIAQMVDEGFAVSSSSLSAIDVWTLSFLFGFQIYFDFSAYSHIALGSARLMGIQFPENFNFPYFAGSPRDFWRRWHISLSSWIRDYLYFPLAGIKPSGNTSKGGLEEAVTENRKNKALFATWAIMGLWHGANWTFVIWGVYHSFVIYIARFLHPLTVTYNSKIKDFAGCCITLFVMMLAWIPFRAESVSDTFIMWGKVIHPMKYSTMNLRENVYLVAAIILICMCLIYWISKSILPALYMRKKLLFCGEVVFFTFVFALVIIFLRPINQFIYFQF